MAFPDDARALAAAPTPAERVRTILATAGSLTLETDGFRCDLVGLHAADPAAGPGAGSGAGPGAAAGPGWLLRLHPPADSALAARVVCAPTGDLPVRLHLTDVAPVGVRDRVRARVTLIGWLAPEPTAAPAAGDRLTLGFDPAEALVVTAGDGAAPATRTWRWWTWTSWPPPAPTRWPTRSRRCCCTWRTATATRSTP